MTFTRRAVLALGAATLPACALAQAAPPDPVAMLKELYKTIDKPRENQPFSKRLMTLYNAASARSKKLNEPVAGLDFDYAVAGQDYEDGMPASVRYEVLSQAANKAAVKVTFQNGGPKELRYALVLDRGRWLIDDVTSVDKDDSWTLSELYRRGAKAPKSR